MLSVSVVGWLTKRNLFAAVKPGQWTQPSTEDPLSTKPPSAWKHLRERGLFKCTVYNCTYSVQVYRWQTCHTGGWKTGTILLRHKPPSAWTYLREGTEQHCSQLPSVHYTMHIPCIYNVYYTCTTFTYMHIAHAHLHTTHTHILDILVSR